MEHQQPPKPLTTITVYEKQSSKNETPLSRNEMQQSPRANLYNNPDKIEIINKTLPTTKEYQRYQEKKEKDFLQIKDNVDLLLDLTKELNKNFKNLDKCFTALAKNHNEQTEAFNSNLDDLYEKIEELSSKNLQDGLKALSSSSFNLDDSDDGEKKSTSEEELTIQEKYEQLTEKIESLRVFFKESLETEYSKKQSQELILNGLQESAADNNETLFKLIEKLKLIDEQTKTNFATIKSQQESQELLMSMNAETILNIQDRLTKLEANDRLVDKDITTLYDSALEYEESLDKRNNNPSILELQEKLSKLEKDDELIKELIQNVVKLENETIAQQNQAISSLWRWVKFLGAFSGGSAIALAVWLWHYTHK